VKREELLKMKKEYGDRVKKEFLPATDRQR